MYRTVLAMSVSLLAILLQPQPAVAVQSAAVPFAVDADSEPDEYPAPDLTIVVETPGTLFKQIGDSLAQTISSLKVIGTINSTDAAALHRLCGRTDYNYATSYWLRHLDLSEARIIGGGDPYYYPTYDYSRQRYPVYTSNDVIGNYMFYSCDRLYTIRLPKTVKRIGARAFSGCSSLRSIDLPDSLEFIGEWAFNSTAITEITIPAATRTISSYAFQTCRSLRTVVLPDSLTTLGRQAFYSSGITSIVLPATISRIDNATFSDCYSLTDIYVRSFTPPTVSGNAFGTTTGKTLYVPAVSLSDYKSATGWKDIPSILPDPTNPLGFSQLTLTPSSVDVDEDRAFTLSLSIPAPAPADLLVALTVDTPDRFELPYEVVIPAGETAITINVLPLDDDQPGQDFAAEFTATAACYKDGRATVLLHDDDMPELQLILTPSKVTEGAGVASVAGTVIRSKHTTGKLTVKLSDDSNGALFFPSRTLEFQKGEQTKNFNFGPLDNNDKDGDRSYSITASVWIASCSCNADGSTYGAATAVLDVLDDDGPSLRLSTTSTAINEGGFATLTIRRNTPTDEDLTVTLASDADERLDYTSTVTIPAGASTTTVEVAALRNAIQGDNRNVVFTVTADGYSTGSCWLIIADQTMADAQVTAIVLSQSEAIAADTLDVTAFVANTGSAPLQEQTRVTFHIDNQAVAAMTAWLQEPLAAGDTIIIQRKVAMPSSVGIHHIHAAVNADHASQELNYTNNVSAPACVTLLPPFSAALSTDKTVYAKGEPVHITGHISGRDIGEKEVEVYAINNGYRHTMTTTTAGDGSFSITYLPYSLQAGHFAVGACYATEALTEEMAFFEIMGLKRTSRSAVVADFHLDEAVTQQIGIRNESQLPLTGVSVRAEQVPEDCHLELSVPSVIDGESTANIDFTISSDVLTEGNDWQTAIIAVTTNEGAEMEIPLYYYCRSHKGHLRPSISNINTTLNIHSARTVLFNVTNIGKGETGTITLALPEWMSSATSQSMPSLESGKSAQIALTLKPTAQMQAGVPVSGQIGVNCELGEGFALPFTIVPVSELTGRIVIDACDEYTYNTFEQPHLADAHVTVAYPASGDVVAEGNTGTDGLFTAELTEGYYAITVEAPRHDTYTSTVLVSPGKADELTVNLSLKAISIDWQVEEIQIEDTYKVSTVINFETNVPVPVVTIDAPASLEADDMQPGDTKPFVVTLTNRGLINAEHAQLLLPEATDEWAITALSDASPRTLAPGQSISIALLLSRGRQTAHAPRRSPYQGFTACMASMEARYQWYCGDSLKSNQYAYTLALKACAHSEILSSFTSSLTDPTNSNPGRWGDGMPGTHGAWEDGGDGPGWPNPDSPGSYADKTVYGEMGVATATGFCDPCTMAKADKALSFSFGAYPICGDAFQWIDNATDVAVDEAKNDDGHISEETADKVADHLGSTLDNIQDIQSGCDNEFASNLVEAAEFIYDFATVCDSMAESDTTLDIDVKRERRKANAEPSWMKSFRLVAQLYYEQLTALDNYFKLFFGDPIWVDEFSSDKRALFKYMAAQPTDEPLTLDALRDHKPESVSLQQLQALVDHFTVPYIDIDALKGECRRFLQLDSIARAAGHASMELWFSEAFAAYKKELSGGQSSVCSSATLRFGSTLTLTRQAFRGTLTIHNGHETEPMGDIRLTPVITSTRGDTVTSDLFDISIESIEALGGDETANGRWALSALTDGRITIQFVPSTKAAPESDTNYNFGGTLAYTDPFTGLMVTRRLQPVTLTVRPAPQLRLDYFVERDIYGDDPLTEEIVEPMLPAEFALIISNWGFGDATNVQLTTEQPTMEVNDKGLQDSLWIVSSMLNGIEAVMPLNGNYINNFGTIQARSTAYAQWWLQSSLMGHFTDYDVSVTRVTSREGVNQSLITAAVCHELIHGFTSPDDVAVRGFLANDSIDGNDLPDIIYFSDGRQAGVHQASDATLTAISTASEPAYELEVTAGSDGWIYGSVPYPAVPADANPVSVSLLGGDTPLPADNFWVTTRTMRDGQDRLIENRLHFIVQIPSGTASFQLLFVNGQPTGIAFTNALAVGTAIYNMIGQRVSHTRKGVYIRAGKKVFVKD